LTGGVVDMRGVAIVAHLLRGALGDDRVAMTECWSDADVELLATTAWTSLRPAA
jgi:hypothetical protein